VRAGGALRVAARRPEQAAELCAQLERALPDAAARPVPVPWGSLGEESRAADVVVNGTSIGLAGQEPALPGVAFRAGQVALDMVYGDTAFARDAAAAAGARLVRGEQLLVRQGAHAFTIWTGRPAPEAVMVAALQRARETTPR
ncbi:MAG TPA: shikimate dehydrogenase (NADP+), partial [Anaeromyxobacteraceae bacterium]|nr:shikimate dehydrogenase (NADP+) [Anaeromyxobacteraceae bacterium]